jgi:hypothetical protein
MDNNAKRCFDRIVPVLVLIAWQALVATRTSCQLLRSAWHDMQHNVKLGYRVSNYTYPKDRNRNKYGARHGSCLAPLLWVPMSTAIYSMLDNIPVKATLHHADGISAHERNVDGFVDDASLIMTVPVTEQDTQTPQYSVEGLTLLAQTAERALFMSGGELELSKYFLYFIQWLWDIKNRPYMASIKEFPEILSITKGTDTDSPIMLQCLEPSESQRTLGVHLDSTGIHETQLLELVKKARQFSAAAAHKSLDRVDSYIVYKILCTPALHYPLPVSNIPSKELKYMQMNLLKTFK